MILTWVELNKLLRATKSEDAALALFNEQRAAGASARIRRRIWSRYSVLRKRRERKEVDAPYTGPRTKKESAA